MIKLIIFDYDGVIVDSFPTVHKVYQIICQRLGKKCPLNFEEFKKTYGKTSRNFAKNLEFSEEDIARADLIYREEILKQKPEFFEGIAEVIDKLHESYKLIMVSSSPYDEVVNKLTTLGVVNFFVDIVAARKSGPMKKREVLPQIIRDQEIKPEDVILIGDRVNDYEDAKSAGITNIILVEYGWGYDKTQVPAQTVKVHKPLDLLEAVRYFETPSKARK